jgi:hypothetical protein
LLTAGWFLHFTAWLHFELLRQLVASWVAVCFPPAATQARAEIKAAPLSKVVASGKYAALLSAIMAATEDPISASVTSIFFLVNKQSMGQLVSTPAYCVSMVCSCVHMLMEAWEHFPHIRKGLGGCLAGLCNLQPQQGDNNGGLDAPPVRQPEGEPSAALQA